MKRTLTALPSTLTTALMDGGRPGVATVAERTFSKPCVNPVVTIGPGYLSEDGIPVSAGEPERTLETVSAEKGLPAGPFV